MHKYEYDSRNQLTLSQDYTSDRMYQYTYSYDENGNINYEDYAVLYYDRASNSITGYVNGGRNEYSYNDSNWSDKVTYYKGAVSYDASGNPTSLDGATLQWENGGWLKSYSKGAVTSTYTYDSNGIRVSKYSSNSEKYTGENREYTTVDGRITSEYVSGGGMGISSYDYRVYYRYDKDNSPIGFDLIKDGTTSTYTYEKNIQGDIVGIISDSTRRRVVTYTYDTWGKVTSVTGTDAETVGKYNSLRYRGYYYDNETGYYYLQSRYYDPSYKRFINADDPTLISELAKASVLGGNLFAYCENNAVMGYDPSGELYIKRFWLALAIDVVLTLIAPAFSGPLDVIGSSLSWYARKKGIKLVWDKLLHGVIPKFKGLFSKFFTLIRKAIWRATGALIANFSSSLFGDAITRIMKFFNKIFKTGIRNKFIDAISCFFSAGSMVAGILDALDGNFDGRIKI